MTSRPTPPAGDVPARRASYATSCTAICVVGSVSRRSWSASSITRQLGMPPPHESHHLPAAVICGGNPFYALELARVLPTGTTLAPGEVVQVPTNLTGLLRDRLRQVPDHAHGLLLAAAALAKPTVALLEQVRGALDEVLATGILEQDGALVRFGHPLLGSLVYADATAQQRRQTHRLLAELLDEPEEQALHLALGTQDPDERAAGRLETAARRAGARGAPDAA